MNAFSYKLHFRDEAVNTFSAVNFHVRKYNRNDRRPALFRIEYQRYILYNQLDTPLRGIPYTYT